MLSGAPYCPLRADIWQTMFKSYFGVCFLIIFLSFSILIIFHRIVRRYVCRIVSPLGFGGAQTRSTNQLVFLTRRFSLKFLICLSRINDLQLTMRSLTPGRPQRHSYCRHEQRQTGVSGPALDSISPPSRKRILGLYHCKKGSLL